MEVGGEAGGLNGRCILIVGDADKFAIESEILEVFEEGRALGRFRLYVGGLAYGLAELDATMMMNPLCGARERIARRGLHTIPDATPRNGRVLANGYLRYYRDLETEGSSADWIEALHRNNVDWEPDGDEALDDGSHIFQIDEGAKVRILAFRNSGPDEAPAEDVREVYLDGDEYYGVLGRWEAAYSAELATWPISSSP